MTENQNADQKKPGLSALDRTKAVDVKDVDMYVFQQKHKITGKVMSIEHFMVIRSKNGRKYVFRQPVEVPPEKRILTK